MQEPDFTNLEEAWDSYPGSELPDPAQAFELTFYAGAQAVLWLLSRGRSFKTLDMEVGDWLACQQERSNATH